MAYHCTEVFISVALTLKMQIAKLSPERWKVFQCLEIEGENSGTDTVRGRDVRPLLITSEQFAAFKARHAQQLCLVPEDNEQMRNSYLILDEKLRFLNNVDGTSCSLLFVI